MLCAMLSSLRRISDLQRRFQDAHISRPTPQGGTGPKCQAVHGAARSLDQHGLRSGPSRLLRRQFVVSRFADIFNNELGITLGEDSNLLGLAINIEEKVSWPRETNRVKITAQARALASMLMHVLNHASWEKRLPFCWICLAAAGVS